MNADQKKRIAHEISNWKNACNCRAVQLAGDRMAALLQELVDGYDATAESSSLIYHGDGTCTLKPGVKAIAYGGDTSAHLIGLPPVGELQIDATEKTAPPAPSVPDGWRYVIPGRRRTEKFDSPRDGDYNQGWNACREATEKALNDLEKRK